MCALISASAEEYSPNTSKSSDEDLLGPMKYLTGMQDK